ncbi:MAG: hypothetical protein ORN29_09150, partial [Rhodoferax sp.]|nr:hypothetical protein [Rhodoferax sp.]
MLALPLPCPNAKTPAKDSPPWSPQKQKNPRRIRRLPPIEGLHTETGPGVYEAAIGFSEALEQADRAILF